ncbi:Hypothetical_protein [Hexamita inflata]|uniref:Hypothetical_protein n=1 Tax=Hexamita inflata TaxID=28002 RepID=A0AA86Q7D3_9EUKA|nr:Hypothetical protein HINF_LOCUS41330 [Hexamita inflata]
MTSQFSTIDPNSLQFEIDALHDSADLQNNTQFTTTELIQQSALKRTIDQKPLKRGVTQSEDVLKVEQYGVNLEQQRKLALQQLLDSEIDMIPLPDQTDLTQILPPNMEAMDSIPKKNEASPVPIELPQQFGNLTKSELNFISPPAAETQVKCDETLIDKSLHIEAPYKLQRTVQKSKVPLIQQSAVQQSQKIDASIILQSYQEQNELQVEIDSDSVQLLNQSLSGKQNRVVQRSRSLAVDKHNEPDITDSLCFASKSVAKSVRFSKFEQPTQELMDYKNQIEILTEQKQMLENELKKYVKLNSDQALHIKQLLNDVQFSKEAAFNHQNVIKELNLQVQSQKVAIAKYQDQLDLQSAEFQLQTEKLQTASQQIKTLQNEVKVQTEEIQLLNTELERKAKPTQITAMPIDKNISKQIRNVRSQFKQLRDIELVQIRKTISNKQKLFNKNCSELENCVQKIIALVPNKQVIQSYLVKFANELKFDQFEQTQLNKINQTNTIINTINNALIDLKISQNALKMNQFANYRDLIFNSVIPLELNEQTVLDKLNSLSNKLQIVEGKYDALQQTKSKNELNAQNQIISIQQEANSVKQIICEQRNTIQNNLQLNINDIIQSVEQMVQICAQKDQQTKNSTQILKKTHAMLIKATKSQPDESIAACIKKLE